LSAWRVRILDEFAGLLAGKTDPMVAAGKLLEIARESVRGLQERRVELQRLLNLLLTYVRDLVIAKEKYESSLLHGDRQTLAREAAALDEEQALEIFDRILQTKDDVEKNVNMQLALEEMCIDVGTAAGGGRGSNG
jgi:hypothetical protein